MFTSQTRRASFAPKGRCGSQIGVISDAIDIDDYEFHRGGNLVDAGMSNEAVSALSLRS